MQPSQSPQARRTEEFVALLTECRRELYQFIYSILPHHAEAEDLFQQTSITLWQKFDEFEPGTNFLRWAERVARFKICDYRKGRHRDRLRFWSDELVECLAESRLEHSEWLAQRRQALAQCLAKLSDRDRELVRQRYEGISTTKALAEQLHKPLVTLYKALGRIRRALHDCIERTISAESGEGK